LRGKSSGIIRGSSSENYHRIISLLPSISSRRKVEIYRYTGVSKKKNGRRGIAPTQNYTHMLKKVINLFLGIKLNFVLAIFLSLSDLFPWWI
jgi:hypothetical protein